MIHQTYHLANDKERCFKESPYRPFDLMSLKLSKWEQQQLCEYAAMRHLHQHSELDRDSWIGFTSVNQHTEARFMTKRCIKDVLSKHDVVVWGWCRSFDLHGHPLSLQQSAELVHPGITEVMNSVTELPATYSTCASGPFHNYFAMSKRLFHEYMNWSLPKVEQLLSLGPQHPFLQRWLRGVGLIAERLLVCWLMSRPLRLMMANDGSKHTTTLTQRDKGGWTFKVTGTAWKPKEVSCSR